MCASEELRRTAYSLVMYVFMRVPRRELVYMQLPPERTDSEVPIRLQDMRSVFCFLQLKPWLRQDHSACPLYSMAFCLPLWFLIHCDVNSLLHRRQLPHSPESLL